MTLKRPLNVFFSFFLGFPAVRIRSDPCWLHVLRDPIKSSSSSRNGMRIGARPHEKQRQLPGGVKNAPTPFDAFKENDDIGVVDLGKVAQDILKYVFS